MPNVKGEYVTDVELIDPKTGEPVTLNVWRNPETGLLFAADTMERPAMNQYLNDPYRDGVRIILEPTFSGLPK